MLLNTGIANAAEHWQWWLRMIKTCPGLYLTGAVLHCSFVYLKMGEQRCRYLKNILKQFAYCEIVFFSENTTTGSWLLVFICSVVPNQLHSCFHKLTWFSWVNVANFSDFSSYILHQFQLSLMLSSVHGWLSCWNCWVILLWHSVLCYTDFGSRWSVSRPLKKTTKTAWKSATLTSVSVKSCKLAATLLVPKYQVSNWLINCYYP